MDKSKFEGFVLAGGKSFRMDADKAFLEFDGESFLERAIKTLAIVCQTRVKTVLNQRQTDFIAKLPADISYIFDCFENRGALGGIHAALNDCRSEWAFVLACDMPFVSPKAIENLAKAAELNENFAVVPQESNGRIQPLGAIYKAKSCLPVLQNLLRRQTSNSVKDFLKLIPVKYIEAELLDRGADVFSNINYPEDYERISKKKEK